MSAARPGFSGRVVNRKFIQQSNFTKGGTPRDPAKRLRFFLPFMWGTCIGVFVGAVILAGGAAMSTVGYYADHYSTTNTTNGTHITSSSKNQSMFYHLTNLTFVGPVLMGIGCFVIVVACVVVLETRDKMVRELLNNLAKPVPKKHSFYDKIIHQMKHTETQPLNDGSVNGLDNLGFELGEDASTNPQTRSRSENGTCLGRRYSTRSVRSALKRIPMEIFAINIDSDSEVHSMLPVRVSDPVAKAASLPALERTYHQRPSVLDAVFQQRSSTPDPERRVLGAAPPDLHDTEGLSSSFPVPDRPKTLYSEEIESDSFFMIHEDDNRRPGGGTIRSHEEAVVADRAPEADPEKSSIVVTVHRASLSRGSSDTSLPSSKEDQVLECFFESDSSTVGDITPRPPRKALRRPARGARPPLHKADSRATLSAVHATIGGHPSAAESSNSDDDSLHLTEDMMRNFDMSMAGTTDPSCPGTAEISIASATTANTLETADSRSCDLSAVGIRDTSAVDTRDTSAADTAEMSFASASTADHVDPTGSSRPAPPEVPLGATMNTRRRGTAVVNPIE